MLRNIDAPAAGASVMVWKSDLITSAAFHVMAQEAFTLAGAGRPEILFVAAYLETTVPTASSNGNTTGLVVDIGVMGGETAYASAIAVMGQPAGRRVSSTPAASALLVQLDQVYVARFTATGGAPVLTNVTFAGRVVILYHPLPTPG